jgi:hypothetical protein
MRLVQRKQQQTISVEKLNVIMKGYKDVWQTGCCWINLKRTELGCFC